MKAWNANAWVHVEVEAGRPMRRVQYNEVAEFGPRVRDLQLPRSLANGKDLMRGTDY